MTCAGIDVAKGHLDLAIRFDSDEVETHRLENDPKGINLLKRLLCETNPERIVLEATSGHERPVSVTLAAASLPVAVVNPRQTGDFAIEPDGLAKTDEIDARVLALFGEPFWRADSARDPSGSVGGSGAVFGPCGPQAATSKDENRGGEPARDRPF